MPVYVARRDPRTGALTHQGSRLVTLRADSDVFRTALNLEAARQSLARDLTQKVRAARRLFEQHTEARQAALMEQAADPKLSTAEWSRRVAEYERWEAEQAKRLGEKEAALKKEAAEGFARAASSRAEYRAVQEMASWGDGAAIHAEGVSRADLERVAATYNRLAQQGLLGDFRRLLAGGPGAQQVVAAWARSALEALESARPEARERARQAAAGGPARRLQAKPEAAESTPHTREFASRLVDALRKRVEAAERDAWQASYRASSVRTVVQGKAAVAEAVEQARLAWEQVVRLEDMLVTAFRRSERLESVSPRRRQAEQNARALAGAGAEMRRDARPGENTFKFGPYNGRRLSDVPIEYLYHVAYGEAEVWEAVETHVGPSHPVIRKVIQEARWGKVRDIVREYLDTPEGERRLDAAFGSSFRARPGERSKVPDLSEEEGEKPPLRGQAPEMEEQSAVAKGLLPRRPAPLTPEEEHQRELLAHREVDPNDPFWETPAAFRGRGMSKAERDLERQLDRTANARREERLYRSGTLGLVYRLSQNPEVPMTFGLRQALKRRYFRARRRFDEEYRDWRADFYTMEPEAPGHFGPGAMAAYHLAVELAEQMDAARSRKSLLDVRREINRQFDPANLGTKFAGQDPAPFVAWLLNRFAERWNSPDLTAETLGLGRESPEGGEDEAAPRRRLGGKGGRGAVHGTDEEIAYLGGEADVTGGEYLGVGPGELPYPEEEVREERIPGRPTYYDVSEPPPTSSEPSPGPEGPQYPNDPSKYRGPGRRMV